MRTDESIERPLRGLRVIEFESIGPGPLAGHMLSELGARVTVVARPTPSPVDRALIGEGMPSSRVFAAAFGAEQPVASNDTRAGRAQNRCVVLVVLS